MRHIGRAYEHKGAATQGSDVDKSEKSRVGRKLVRVALALSRTKKGA